MADKNVGTIVQIIGPVIDVEFQAGHLPEIYNALHVVSQGQGGAAALDVIAEVEQHLGENRVRAVAMKPTTGMQRGMKATARTRFSPRCCSTSAITSSAAAPP